MDKNNILIIDDERTICEFISDILKEDGYACHSLHEPSHVSGYIKLNIPDVILLDIWFEKSEVDGIELLKLIKEINPVVPVIMISGHGNIGLAVKAIKYGAYDFIEKPFKTARLLLTVKRALESLKISEENKILRCSNIGMGVVGISHQAKRVQELVRAASISKSRIFISGEVGVGKYTIAKIIHMNSTDNNMQFIRWSSVKNYYKGSNEVWLLKKIISISSGGVFYIDSLESLGLDVQDYLLYLLRNNYEGVRVISSASSELIHAMNDGTFLSDLYYRLCIVKIHISPLHERAEDIAYFCTLFLQELSDKYKYSTCKMSQQSISMLMGYNWPGNIIQLKNVVELSFMLALSKNMTTITPDILPIDLLTESEEITSKFSKLNSMKLKEAREEFEKQYIKLHLTRFKHNVAKTAEYIGMDRTALHRKISLWGFK